MKEPAATYEIQIRDYLNSHWADWLGGMTLTHTADGATLLRGVLPDQAALYGVLTSLRDLGLTLIAVRRVESEAVFGTTHDEETNMSHVRSKDGTNIAFDQLGEGPPVILVCGGSVDRMSNAPLAALLAQHFMVFNYDRRGRGDSGDTPPYAVEREVEDLEAVIAAAGGSACVYGTSSGGALALEAARTLPARIMKLALWEPPFSPEGYPRPPANTAQVFSELTAAGRRGHAVEYFMAQVVGLPPEFVAQGALRRGGRRRRRWRTPSPTTPPSWATIRSPRSGWPRSKLRRS